MPCWVLKALKFFFFSKVYNVLDEIPEYGGQSTLVIAIIGHKACLDLQISVCDNKKVSCSEQSFGL